MKQQAFFLKKCIEFSFKKKFQLTSGRKALYIVIVEKLFHTQMRREKLINFALKKLNWIKH